MNTSTSKNAVSSNGGGKKATPLAATIALSLEASPQEQEHACEGEEGKEEGRYRRELRRRWRWPRHPHRLTSWPARSSSRRRRVCRRRDRAQRVAVEDECRPSLRLEGAGAK
jgi:hypothetical protein